MKKGEIIEGLILLKNKMYEEPASSVKANSSMSFKRGKAHFSATDACFY
jgi:hypothetical protein